ncbi:hypothetical protein COU19_00500 [Candidatus Kaiserbacteria bacterium CG10_big_fil_rev_8_21_14_0_10_56_12]|uniref:GtrA/DPMS transmembrane domain-containing protein n=1 Tax=Candidatus Kaiserbacteria bacterium CG10_big_fil_rev_8_21_14_0_10_56_12 TaxID=1974611 RepID=A0A2H0UAL6_9BACT|nr:MAG: hypothetical protein COU19_00500 [Candidatus Kaiserbacteria bacterium CG10_big_fil_rev_8_21_14_0_10_56_12]
MRRIVAFVRERSALLVRYGLVGAAGGVLQTLILIVWVDLLGLANYYLWGAALGFVVALAVTFTLQKYWTFRDNERAVWRRQFALYSSIACMNLVLTLVLLWAGKRMLEWLKLDFFHGWYVLVQIVIIVFLAGLSFAANYLITFATSSATEVV